MNETEKHIRCAGGSDIPRANFFKTKNSIESSAIKNLRFNVALSTNQYFAW